VLAGFSLGENRRRDFGAIPCIGIRWNGSVAGDGEGIGRTGGHGAGSVAGAGAGVGSAWLVQRTVSCLTFCYVGAGGKVPLAAKKARLADFCEDREMKAMLQWVLCLPVCAAVCVAQMAPPQQKTNPLQFSTQILVVTTSDWTAVDGAMQRYERTRPGKHWKAVGEPVAIVVGKTGLAWGLGIAPKDAAGVRRADDPAKHEGDGKSPAGVFRLGTAFGYAAQPLAGWKMPYRPLTPSTECVDDPDSQFYNRIADRTAVTPDWNSSEHMRDTGEYYRWGLVVEHNVDPATPGSGSCIFLHIWGGPGRGTAGCTAMERPELETVLAWLDPQRYPLLIQMPAAEYETLRGKWQLPNAPRLIAAREGGV